MERLYMADDLDKLEFMREPWEHQKEFLRRAIPHNNFAAFYEVGTGKTFTCINMLRYLYSKSGGILRTLILCPPIVIKNWEAEILAFSKIKKDSIVCLKGTGKQRVKMMQKVFDESFDRIVVTNYESLLMEDLHALFMQYDFDIIVSDEIHLLKNSTSKRSKQLYLLGDRCRYRYGLTGTPILNTPMDVFGIFRFLDKGERFGKNNFSFKIQYFFDKNANMPSHKHFPDWQPRPSMMQQLSERMSDITHHVKKSECLDLPPYVKKTIFVELTAEQQRLYNDMKRELIAFINEQGGLDNKAVVANLALTKALRMMQIVSGHCTTETIEGVKDTHFTKTNPKGEALEQLLTDLSPHHKIIVWGVFKADFKIIRNICEKLNIKYVEVHGDIADKKKDQNVKDFNEDDSVRVFVGHPKSGGIGINLIVSDVTIYYSRSFSLGDDLQSEARNYRGGSERHSSITRYDIVAENTIDQECVARLHQKVEIGSKILTDMAGKNEFGFK